MGIVHKVPKGWKKVSLESIADVQTGISKGGASAKSGNPIQVPYLRVANVQRGAFDLSEVKLIDIDEAKVDRYKLFPGDVLMTEGG